MTSPPAQEKGTLTQLNERLSSLTFRRSGLSLGLWGEAGVGKTFAAKRLLSGLPLKSASVHATTPLRSLLLALPRPRKLPAWLEHSLDKLQTDPFADIGSPELLLTGLLSVNAPFVLHVEDWHEADPERQAFWVQLAQGTQRSRGVGLLMTSRTTLSPEFNAIHLQPLSRTESDALMEAQVGVSLPPEALAWVWQQAAGNPLFTLEYFRFLARKGFLWNDGQQ